MSMINPPTIKTLRQRLKHAQVEQCHVIANTLFNTYVFDIVNIITRGMVRYLTP